MYYKVTARLKAKTAGEFHCKLHDDSIQSQKPDGQEIVDSMQRAVVIEDGRIRWSEVCYCKSPIYHERTTVYDQHFDELRTEVIDGYEAYEGRPFMDYLTEIITKIE